MIEKEASTEEDLPKLAAMRTIVVSFQVWPCETL